jgi:hypothetical protein
MDVEIGAQKKAPAPPMIGLNEGSALLTFYFGQFEQKWLSNRELNPILTSYEIPE